MCDCHKIVKVLEHGVAWWGYRHTNGEIQVKRWFAPAGYELMCDLCHEKKETSPFVDFLIPHLFSAHSREEALLLAETLCTPANPKAMMREEKKIEVEPRWEGIDLED